MPWMKVTIDHQEAHRFLQNINTRDCLKFCELKYEVVTATKVVGKHSHPNLCPPGQSRVCLTRCRGCALSMVPRVWRRYVPHPRTTLERPRQWLMAIPLEDAAIKKPGCVRGTRNQPGLVENRNGDGAPCLTPLLAYQGNNSAMHSQCLVFTNLSW